MRKGLATLAMACVFAVVFQAAASACEYGQQATTASASDNTDATAQAQPASAKD